jgi:hypothetical protein
VQSGGNAGGPTSNDENTHRDDSSHADAAISTTSSVWFLHREWPRRPIEPFRENKGETLQRDGNTVPQHDNAMADG